MILTVEQNRNFAHPAVLSDKLIFIFLKINHQSLFNLARSPYFKAMFTGELAESRQTEIIIHDIDECTMELLIHYCYTSRIVVDERTVQILLPVVCVLQV